MTIANEMRILADEYYERDGLYKNFALSDIILDMEEDVRHKAKNGNYSIRKDVHKNVAYREIMQHFESQGFQCEFARNIFKNSITIKW